MTTALASVITALLLMSSFQFLSSAKPKRTVNIWTPGTTVMAGSFPGASEAAQRFSAALATNNYSAIYDGLHSTAKSQVTKAQYVQASRCRPQATLHNVQVRRLDVQKHVAYISYVWYIYKDLGLYSVREWHGLFQLMWWEDGAWRWTTTASLDDTLASWAKTSCGRKT